MALSLPEPLARTPLTAADENLLFGREAEIRKIVDNCQVDRLTVVTSPSGMGVSSLLRAGVAPALQRAGFITVVYSDWQGRYFTPQLRDAITSAVRTQTNIDFFAAPEPLRDVVIDVREATGKRLAILLDQFEDYVRFHTGTDISDDFDAMLANAVGSRAGAFVIGLQAPAVPSFERLSQYIPNLLGHRVSLQGISPDAAAELARERASRTEMTVEPAVIEQLIVSSAIAAEGGAHPLFLKLAIDSLAIAETNLKSKALRATTLAANGGADKLILESLDSLINDLGATPADLLFRWTPLLISPEGQRTSASEKTLLANSGRWNKVAVNLIPQLGESGMLRTIETASGTRYEYARDALAVVIRDWWLRREATLIARRRAMFRIRSISIAVGAILVAYGIYLYMSLKQG